MKTIKNVIFFLFLSCLIKGCGETKPLLTPLQIQEIQTKKFEQNKKIVFSSVISVFQDLGYTINSADIDTGIISAESTAKSDQYSFIFGITKVKQTKANAFIERIADYTKVRLNFVNITQSSSKEGQNDRNDVRILDTNTYANAFEKIENAIFIRDIN